MKIGILIDSGAYIDNNQLKDTVINTIPLHVILGDSTEFLDLPDNIIKHKIYERLNNGENITTSMASPGECMEKYEQMLKTYDHILHLTITPNLSGMHETAIMVSRDEDFLGKVTVIEHNLAANAITYLALKMDKMIKDGETDISKFQDFANSVDEKVFLGLLPGDITKLSKGGRTKSMLLSFLKVFKTRFLIVWGKKPKKEAMARTVGSLIEKAIDASIKKSGKDTKYIFVHTPEASNRIIESAKQVLERKGVEFIDELLPSIYGCHAGTETIGLIGIPKELI